MNHNKSIQVRLFVHHNQPYGTDYIDGIWTPYTIEDVNQERINDVQCDNESNEPSWKFGNSSHAMIKARLDNHGGVLTGTIIKGSTTNRMFQHTSTTDNAGQVCHELYVSKRDVLKNTMTSVAM